MPQEPYRQIVYWYRQAFDIAVRLARTAIKPQQTLREFAQENRHALGPAATYFISLTRILEKAIYSRSQPTPEDVEQSKQLSLSVKDRVKG